MRLIDADAMKERLQSVYEENCTIGGLTLNIPALFEAVDSVPTYEAPIPDFPRVKTRDELLSADWDTLTDEEKERRQRAKAIPEEIVEACQEKYYILRSEVIKLESKMDVIDTFLCGYKKGVRDE